jgi:hypothetical protein
LIEKAYGVISMHRIQRLSEARAEANSRNARKSTGPKTVAGKTASRLNATTHGLLSGLQVLPQVECQRDWEIHRELMLDSLKPLGYLESSLAERIALFFWRLGRIARYEREVAAILQESLAEEIAESRRAKAEVDSLFAASTTSPLAARDDIHPDEVISRTGKARKELARLEGFPAVTDAAELTPDQALTLVYAIESVSEVDIDDEGFPSFPGIPNSVTVEDFDRWTAGIVRDAWKAIATTAGVSLETLYAMAVTRARAELLSSRIERKRVLTQLDRGRRLRLLPGSQDLEKIGRYEAHLERCLYRAMHELQRFQAARAGLIPPPLAVDVNLTGGGLD